MTEPTTRLSLTASLQKLDADHKAKRNALVQQLDDFEDYEQRTKESAENHESRIIFSANNLDHHAIIYKHMIANTQTHVTIVSSDPDAYYAYDPEIEQALANVFLNKGQITLVTTPEMFESGQDKIVQLLNSYTGYGYYQEQIQIYTANLSPLQTMKIDHMVLVDDEGSAFNYLAKNDLSFVQANFNDADLYAKNKAFIDPIMENAQLRNQINDLTGPKTQHEWVAQQTEQKEKQKWPNRALKFVKGLVT